MAPPQNKAWTIPHQTKRQQVLGDTELELRRLIRMHPQSPVIQKALRHWLRQHHMDAHLWARYPPCFAAAIGEAFALTLLRHHPREAAQTAWDASTLLVFLFNLYFV